MIEGNAEKNFSFAKIGLKMLVCEIGSLCYNVKSYGSINSLYEWPIKPSLKIKFIYDNATIGIFKKDNVVEVDESENCYVRVETLCDPTVIEAFITGGCSPIVFQDIRAHKVLLGHAISAIVTHTPLDVEVEDWENETDSRFPLDDEFKKLPAKKIFYFRGFSTLLDTRHRHEEWEELKQRNIQEGKKSVDNLIQAIEIILKRESHHPSLKGQTISFLKKQSELLANSKKNSGTV